MSKKLKVYQILTFALGLAFVGLCLFVGITAVHKSMKLKLGFTAEPSIYCYIEYKLSSEADYEYKPLFSNVTNTGASLIPSVNTLATLSGNTLILTQEFEDLGASFDFKIYNYNDFALEVTCAGISKNTTAKTSATNVETDADAIVFTSVTTGGADIIFSFCKLVREITYTTSTLDPTNSANISGGWATPIEVAPGENLAEKKFTISAEGYSVGVKVEGDCDYSYNPITGVLSISDIQSDIAVTAQANPWQYYTYGSGEAFEGYTYIKFADGSSTEWVIIGSGDNLTSSLFSTSIAGYDAEKGFGQTYDYNGSALIGPNPNPTDKSANGTGTSKELADNQILLLRREMLAETSIFGPTDEWASSVVKSYLNTTWADLNNYKTHMVAPSLYTTCYKNGAGTSTLDDGDDTKIFLLGSRYGFTSSGKLPNVNGEFLSYSGYATQNFLLEDYLGTYLSYTTASNPRIFTYTATSSYWWLRSGRYSDYYGDYIAYSVYSGGYINGSDVRSSDGVRPSFILNLA